jgi:hypothetical protein
MVISNYVSDMAQTRLRGTLHHRHNEGHCNRDKWTRALSSFPGSGASRYTVAASHWLWNIDSLHPSFLSESARCANAAATSGDT